MNFRTPPGDSTDPSGITFGKVLETVAEKSVNALLLNLNPISRKFGLDEIKGPMLSRMKSNAFNPKLAKQCDVLRILAYWIGKKFPERGWHYERLCALPRDTVRESRTCKETEGVVVIFKIRENRKDAIVESKEIDWIEAGIMETVSELGLSGMFGKKDIEKSSMVSYRMKLAKSPGLSGEPRLYGAAMRNALAIAHQMVVRWFLSETVNPRNRFEIILFAGQFTDANLPFLAAKSDFEGCRVYLTDFACQCCKITDMKIMIGKTPDHITINGVNKVNLWILEYFWSHRYFELYSGLLKENILPVSEREQNEFRCELYIPDGHDIKKFKALKIIRRFPHNMLFIFEVVKALMARRMLREADMILSNLAGLDQYNVLVRIFRILIYANLALDQSLLATSELTFKRAIEEGRFITKYYDGEPELWHALSRTYIARGLRHLSSLRKDGLAGESRSNVEKRMFESFEQAEKASFKGITASTAGQDPNNSFLFITTRCLRMLVKTDPSLADREKKPELRDVHNVYQKTALSLFLMNGWLTAPSDKCRAESEILGNIPDSEIRNFLKFAVKIVDHVQFLALSRHYLPSAKYSSCCFFWDLMPKLTVGVCKKVRQWLMDARESARYLSENRLAVDVIAPLFPKDPEAFQRTMDKTIDTINSLIPKKEWQKDDDDFLDESVMREVSKVKLMLLHFD